MSNDKRPKDFEDTVNASAKANKEVQEMLDRTRVSQGFADGTKKSKQNKGAEDHFVKWTSNNSNKKG